MTVVSSVVVCVNAVPPSPEAGLVVDFLIPYLLSLIIIANVIVVLSTLQGWVGRRCYYCHCQQGGRGPPKIAAVCYPESW